MAGKITDLPAASAVNAADLAEIVQGGTNKKSTFAMIALMVSIANRYVVTVGDASNISFVIPHNLNTRNVHVTLRRTVAPYDEAIVDNQATDANNVTLLFSGTPPLLNQWTVTITR